MTTSKTMNSTTAFVTAMQQHYHAARNENNAAAMIRYMRDQFPYLGLKAPERKALYQQFIDKQGIPDIDEVPAVVKALWQLPEREFQYDALTLLEKIHKKWPEHFISLFESLITEKSWWDTVDTLSKLVGMYFRKYPAQRLPVTERWINSSNIWLQRSALIFQLHYKQDTDTRLLFDYILRCNTSKEFFIQKAIGWALRQLAKTNPTAVQSFVANNTLAPLSIREALKHL